MSQDNDIYTNGLNALSVFKEKALNSDSSGKLLSDNTNVRPSSTNKPLEQCLITNSFVSRKMNWVWLNVIGEDIEKGQLRINDKATEQFIRSRQAQALIEMQEARNEQK